MLDKATMRRKRLQMLSEVTSKTYNNLKREAGDRSQWQEDVINLHEAEDRREHSINQSINLNFYSGLSSKDHC